MAQDHEFHALLNEHAQMIQRIAQTYERRPALVQELVQEIALALWRATKTFRGDSSMRTFVGRVAHNISVSHVRKESRGKYDELPDGTTDSLVDTSPGIEELTQQDERRALLLSAVRKLPLNLRPVVTLHLEGFSNQEVADALDLTVNNVGVRLNRGRTALKQLLGKNS